MNSELFKTLLALYVYPCSEAQPIPNARPLPGSGAAAPSAQTYLRATVR